jgi:signal transduction histidine kinase
MSAPAAPAPAATGLWEWYDHLPAWLRDVWPALVVGILQVGVVALAGAHQDDVRTLDAAGVALLAAGPAALVLRRYRPVLCLALVLAATMGYWLTTYPRGPAFLALIVAYVNAAMRGHRRAAWTCLVVGYLIVAWIVPLVHDDPFPDWPVVAGVAAWLLLLAAGTELVRSHRERTAAADAARAEEARRAASEERVRIARDLHDVLAHDISLISVQAGVALHLLDEHPEQARPALRAIRDASGDALSELRSVLDILRQGEAVPREPTAGLRDLDALVLRSRATGLDVVVEGAAVVRATRLSPGVDLAAFRIVQEALTNVVRHAHAERATVRFRCDDGVLVVQVDDDGVGTPPGADRAGAAGASAAAAGAAAGGRGIVGMRERARALGGDLDAGPRPGRGFRVRARFPLDGATT